MVTGNESINVKKRNGRGTEPLNIDKIHEMVEYACEDITGVSASQVEMRSGEEEDDEEDDEDGDFEVEDVTINGVDYVATNTNNGTIYKLDSDGEILEDDDGEFLKAGYYK